MYEQPITEFKRCARSLALLTVAAYSSGAPYQAAAAEANDAQSPARPAPAAVGGLAALERFFTIRERGSTLGTEIRGEVTTFIVIAYILAANPVVVSVNARGNGPEFIATSTMTALAAGVMTLVSGSGRTIPSPWRADSA